MPKDFNHREHKTQGGNFWPQISRMGSDREVVIPASFRRSEVLVDSGGLAISPSCPRPAASSWRPSRAGTGPGAVSEEEPRARQSFGDLHHCCQAKGYHRNHQYATLGERATCTPYWQRDKIGVYRVPAFCYHLSLVPEYGDVPSLGRDPRKRWSVK